MHELPIEGPRAATPRDLPGVIALVDEAMRGGTGQTMGDDYPLVYEERNLENIRVLTAGGEVVAVVPFVARDVVLDGCAFRIGIISPTATAPAHRHRGFGLRCLRSAIARMEEAGCELSVLWTRTETFPFYEHEGYQAVRYQAARYVCRRDDQARFAVGGERVIELDPGDPAALEAIRLMHEREETGVRRAAREYPALFALPRMKTLLALRDGAPAAYLVVSRAVNKPGLIEGGGDERALETLVGRALSEIEPDEPVAAHANLSETVLERVLRRRLADRREIVPAGMMIRVNTPRGFLARVAPALERRNGGADRVFSVALTDAGETLGLCFSPGGLEIDGARRAAHFDLSRREWASVLFGAHPVRPVEPPAPCAGWLPLYFPIWTLDRS